jgi:hypothetical protein
MAYVCFLSFAHDDEQHGGETVPIFYKELVDKLAVVHGKAALGDGVFKADVSIAPGEDWHQTALPRALDTSHVLVCLQSPNYFLSEYCGKELEVFLQRRQRFVALHGGGEPPDCIIPVLWQPTVRNRPRTLPTLQWTLPNGGPSQVEMRGLFEAIDADDRGWRPFVRRLAERISNLLITNVGTNSLPSLATRPLLEAIPSAFDPPSLPLRDLDLVQGRGPRAITFIYPSGLQDWPFSPPPEDAAVIRAAAIAKASEMAIQGIEFVPTQADFAQRVAYARELNSSIILMLTGHSLHDPNVKARFAEMPLEDVATIVVGDSDLGFLPPERQRKLRAYGVLHSGVLTADALDKAVTTSLATLRERLSQEARVTIARPTEHQTLPGLQ